MAEKDNGEIPLQKQIQAMILAAQDAIELKTEQKFNSLVLETETLNQVAKTLASKKDVNDLRDVINSVQGGFKQFQEDAVKNQKVIDSFVASQNGRNGNTERKDFGTAWSEQIAHAFESKKTEFEALGKGDKNAKATVELKVGPMLIANVTGDTVAGYNQRQGLVPNQKINLRDLIPTTPSPTGMFVTYRETGTSGAIGVQTEGQSKSLIDYSFTEIKTVSHYIAGVVDFTKQLMYALPWLQTTLPRLLLRDFYKKENDYLYSAMQTAALGDSTTTGANTMEQILDLIANQEDADFTASYILGKARLWAALMATKGTAEYGVPGGVTIDPSTGRLMLTGIPYIKASFADANSLLIWDNEQLERVETETLRVEFSFENEDNFKKNKVTAKVECFEELNVLRPDAIISTTTS